MARILIIDDSEIIRNLLRDYLSDRGHDIDVAKDGQDGIEHALANEYDVFFCDLHMPKKNGFQVFSAVTAVKPKARFIMTDSLPDELAARAQEAGAYCCLVKPFDLDLLVSTLDEILASQKHYE